MRANIYLDEEENEEIRNLACQDKITIIQALNLLKTKDKK
jgi:hypothetical protein